MVLVSNQVVREDWRKAKALVGDTLVKHGANVKALRRYEERRLAYPIAGNQRATYYLSYFEMPGENMPAFKRDFDLSEQVLRYLVQAVEVMPEDEPAKAALEDGTDYTVPEPPADDEPVIEEGVTEEEVDEDSDVDSDDEDSDEGKED
ncbi:MAG: 30S ribosomal protein S6 [Planctomycetota bacterium]